MLLTLVLLCCGTMEPVNKQQSILYKQWRIDENKAWDEYHAKKEAELDVIVDKLKDFLYPYKGIDVWNVHVKMKSWNAPIEIWAVDAKAVEKIRKQIEAFAGPNHSITILQKPFPL